MSSRWKKVWADFWGNKSRTVLTIMTIFVGTFAVGFNANLGPFMNDSMDSDYLSALPSEGTISAYPLDDNLVKIARSVPGVDGVEGRSALSANVMHTDGRTIPIVFTSVKDPNTLTLNLLKPAEGETTVPPLNNKQILADSSLATLGYKPGDTIIVKLFNGKVRELTVAGYIHNVTGFPYGPWAQIIFAYVTPDTVEWLGGSSSYNELVISVSENQADREHVLEVFQAVADRLEEAGVAVNSISVTQPGHHFSWSISQGIFFLLSFLGYMVVFLSCFLIINTVTALMAQHTRQIGIIKALGGRTMQIFGMYLTLILLFGLIALIIAIPLGGQAAKITGTGMAATLGFFPLPFKLYPQAVVQQILVGLVVPLLAVVLPVYNSVRITIREAITNYGIGTNTKPADKSVSKSALFIPRPMRLSLRNTFRRKTRLALTLIALVLGGSIFIGVINTQATFESLIDDLQGYSLADVNVSFEHDYRYEQVAPIALGNSDVSSAEGWLTYTGKLVTNKDDAGTDFSFVALPANSDLIDPIIATGRWLKPSDDNAVVISNHFLNKFPDTKIGDWLTIKIDDKETKWQIVGMYTIALDTSTLYVNYDYFTRIVGQPNQVKSLQVLTHQHDPATQSRIANELRTLYEAQGIKVTSAMTATESWIAARSIFNVVVYFMSVMAMLIAVVGGLGLMGTMSISVLERTREIGVLRAIGAGNGDIQSIVIVEGMIIGLMSWAISVLVAVPITSLLSYGVGVSILKVPLSPVYNMAGIVAWLVFTLVLAAIASAFPARGASRLTVKDTLAYE